ncbi:hypothetical protein BDN70DRAFT_826014 [Pholiota conissans]|uniref:Uncharacterized protein n=1 Tax=Pholiota conissans TaxID=109636 RepID=A0A9P5ZCS2_9AGAR|nr:hypothetical protein BDN70DRAFT_826014 [Pholiota conissans]
MANSPSHRPTQSIQGNLQPPTQGGSQETKQQRRMTSPVGGLNLPDTGRRSSPRPPSPLRNGYIMDTSTGIDPHGSEDGSDDDDEDDPAKWKRSPSPASSVSHLAASFVQRVNDFVGGIKSPSLLSDAELEAQAERERDRSRREAEAILTKEAQQRKQVEERVLAMMESTRSLPPPPSRSQTMPNPPSPAASQKSESSWWAAAKNKLTPSKDKEPLTPAQQVIQEAKEREKKNGKGKEKEWPSNAQSKYNDQAMTNLVAPPMRKPVPPSPSSPTPSRPSLSNMAPNLTPSPMRTTDTISSSPSREAPPLYAQFNTQGTLDVPGTLLAIAKRFEKLEKWTVGHVRALEDRMNDVERWLVDKEKAKTDESSATGVQQPQVQQELQEMREEVSELQGRVGELGREMAKLATAPSNMFSAPKAQPATVQPPMQVTSSVLVQHNTGSSIPSTPHHRRISTSATDSTSPPLAARRVASGTRLPYPQGDYTSPPDAFSPPNSPPGSLTKRALPITIPGAASANPGPLSAVSTSYSSASFSTASSYGRTMSPTPMTAAARAISPTPANTGLPAPKQQTSRQSSVSPTPRKRYTVALGGPLIPPDELSSNAAESTAKANKDDDDVDDDEWFGGETVGKSSGLRLANASANANTKASSNPAATNTNMTPMAGSAGVGDYKSAASASPSPLSSRRMRAQSAYGFSSIAGASGTTANAVLNPHNLPSVAPLRTLNKTRSKSTERIGGSSGTGDSFVSGVSGTGTALGGTKFVDPLVLRKQSRDSLTKPIAMPKPIGKVPIGQLVAFFDGEKK